MTNRSIRGCLLIGTLAALLAGPRAATAAAPEAERRVADFNLRDARGREHSAAEWRGQKAVVLLFLGVECPVSNGYAPEMRRIAEQYGLRGVAFYGIHPDPDVSPAVAAQHAAEYGLTFPILLDPEQSVARRAGVRVTPEAVVLAPDGRVLYRGRIDDLYTSRGQRRNGATTADLRDALDAALAGRPPAVPATEAFGCLLPRPRPDEAPSSPK